MSFCPDLIRDAGYRTGFFGKWHAKLPSDFRPADHFDEFESIFRNPYFKRQADGTLRHETDIICDRVIEFLRPSPMTSPSLSMPGSTRRMLKTVTIVQGWDTIPGHLRSTDCTTISSSHHLVWTIQQFMMRNQPTCKHPSIANGIFGGGIHRKSIRRISARISA